MIYSFVCRECGSVAESQSPERSHECCGTRMARDYSTVQIGAGSFQPHYNYSVGEFVRSDREFRDALKRKAEDNSNLTGISHSYEPLYPGEAPTPSTHTEAIELARKAIHDGRPPTKEEVSAVQE